MSAAAPPPWVRQLAVIEDHDGATETCSCGAPGVCVGQFEGEMLPRVCCDKCCDHVDFDECGRCWPLPVDALTIGHVRGMS